MTGPVTISPHSARGTLAATYADILRPTVRRMALVYDVAMVAGGSLLVALAAQVTVYLPGTLVPITGQTLAVLVVGAVLGGRRGAACLLLYIAEGAAGLPFFSGAHGGVGHLLGPTGGYLWGFVAAAGLTGTLAQRGWDRRLGTTILAMTIGTAAIYLFGLLWLALFVGGERVLAEGLYPFLPGAVLKIVAAALLLPLGWKLLRPQEDTGSESKAAPDSWGSQEP